MFRTAVAIPTALCGAIYWKGHSHLTNSTRNYNDRLVYVQVYHRHGARSPDVAIYADTIEESKVWIPLLSKQYYSSEEMTEAINSNSHDLNYWSNVRHKLNGTYLKPINISDDDKNKDCMTRDARYPSVWIGQLSENGAVQLHDFGKWLRSRYVDKLCYLPSTYKSSYNESCKLYVESTNYKRTIFSVDSLLNGLYGTYQRNKGEKIPIHIDKELNHLLFVSRKCPIYYKEMYWPYNPLNPQCVSRKENMTDDIFQIQTKLQDFYKCTNIASSLKARLMQNIDLPPNIDTNDVTKYVEYIYSFLIEFFKRNDMLRISNGVLFDKLLNSMKYDNNKFIVSSGHDFTIMALICSLLRKCKNENTIKQHGKWPKYGDNVIFEVWEFAKNNKRFVRILHNKKVFPINGKEFISLDELENMWKDLIISPQTLWNTECCC